MRRVINGGSSDRTNPTRAKKRKAAVIRRDVHCDRVRVAAFKLELGPHPSIDGSSRRIALGDALWSVPHLQQYGSIVRIVIWTGYTHQRITAEHDGRSQRRK